MGWGLKIVLQTDFRGQFGPIHIKMGVFFMGWGGHGPLWPP
jgi:hypothetical protein